MTITPGIYDITIYQGASFAQTLTWQDENGAPVNLTTYTARLMARSSVDATDAFITLTTENAGITLGGAAGTIALSLTAAQTSVLEKTSGVYDLELVVGTQVIRLLQGNLLVSREVTR